MQKQAITIISPSKKAPNIPESAVDVVVLRYAYHHVLKPIEFITALKASLRPGGKVIVINSSSDTEDHLLPSWEKNCKHVKPLSDYQEQFEAAGFKLMRSEVTPSKSILTEWVVK